MVMLEEVVGVPKTGVPCDGEAENKFPPALKGLLVAAAPPKMEPDEELPPNIEAPGLGEPPKMEAAVFDSVESGFVSSAAGSSSSLTSGSSSSLSGSSLSSVSP